jgi:CDP-L-myo-inositol myo-inositolphosphotransferase
LIERVIRCAFEAGADDFYVVIGYQGEHVRAFLEGLAGRMRVPITSIANEVWDKENGLSVLKAREYLRDPFLLLMSDHLFDPSIARELMEVPPDDGEIVLGVDGNTSNPLIDMQDVTRVRTEGGKIVDVGKGLTRFNGFDTGIFMCTPALFDALERSQAEHGDAALSGGVRVLAAERRVKAVEVNGRFWIDVDDSATFKRAENTLLATLREKPNDGPVSRYFNRPLSVRISRRLLNHRITPNQISLFSFLCCVTAAGLFTLGGYPALLLGGLLAQFASVIDGCDGEVARLKFQSSRYGAWFDAVLDRYADAFLLFGLMWHAYAGRTHGLILLTGFLAIIGSFMLSYTADKYDGLMRHRVSHGGGFRLGRDVRVFLIFLGAIFNQAFLTLVVIAAVMNIETIRRVIISRGSDAHGANNAGRPRLRVSQSAPSGPRWPSSPSRLARRTR